MNRYLKYIVTNGSFVFFLWLALYKHNGFASFIVQVFIWLGVITCACFLSDEFTEKMKDTMLANSKSVVLNIFDVLFDIAVVSQFLKFGWYISAYAYALTIIVILVEKNIAVKEDKKNEKIIS